MRKLMRYMLVFVLIFFIVQSWTFFRYQPQENSEFRIHPLGMRIYNMTRGAISEKEWVGIFRVVDDASQEFKQCIGASLFPFEGKLFQRSIVIVPAERIFIFGEWVDRFVDLHSMFIRKDDFIIKALRHEWTHLYLYVSGERFLGDIFHRDPLFFEKCKFASDDSDY